MSDLSALGFLALWLESLGQQAPPPGQPGPPGPPAPWPSDVAPIPPPPMDVPPAPGPEVFPRQDMPPDHVQPGAMDDAGPPHRIPPPGDIPPRPAPAPAPIIPPGVMPPMPPWPAPPAPAGLPPFPGPAWVPDTPVTPTVAARAAYWNPILWNYSTRTQRKPYAQEQLNGQWVTFAAAWHPGSDGPRTYMATEAWRLASSPPVAPPAPAPPPPGPLPAGLSALQQAASNMNSALAASGYRKSDQPLYKAFQAQAFPGSVPDGFPGTHTMNTLASVLATAQIAMAPVHVYPWHARPGTTGYDGQNAPTWAEWNR